MSYSVFNQLNENIFNSDNLDCCVNFINYLFIKDVLHKSGYYLREYRIVNENTQYIYSFQKDADNKTYHIVY